MRCLRIICESSDCPHREGKGQYGLCEHPANKQLITYNGITRIYASKCDLIDRERRMKGEKK